MRKAVAGCLVMLLGSTAWADQGSEGEKKKTPPRWAGSEVSLRFSASAISFSRTAEPTYNPEVVQSISLDPRWRLTDKISLVGHLGIETELTNSDVTTTEHEPLLDDLWIQAGYALTGLPAKLSGGASLRLSLPTSKESQARRKIFSLSPAVSLRRSFPVNANLVITPSFAFRFTWHNNTSTSLVYDAPTVQGCQFPRDTCEEFDHSGTRSAAAGFSETIGATASFPKLKLEATLQIGWIQSWLYDLTPITNPVTGEPVPESESNVNWRHANLYLIGADWQAHQRVRVGAGFQTINPQLAPDSTYYAPFFNRFTTFYVTAAAVF